MPGQYWARKLGVRAEEDYYQDEYDQFMQIDQQRRMPLASLGSNNIYPKGALVLQMLKHYLGEQRFWASVHRYLTDHAFDNATTDDMRQAVLDASGENLDWFWDQWIYQAGYPEFTVAAKYDSSASIVTLVVQQVQQDSSKADSTGLRYTTPAAFRMPVTVRVGTPRGDVTARAQLSQRLDTILVRDVKSAPTMVIFDDGNTILKRLTFDQPTAWLATQLQRDPNLWNRQWVIAQLAQRTKDPAAGAALAQAATTADYFRVRGAAASVLDTVDARANQDHFALHVLAALAGRGNGRALDLLTKHLDDDRPSARRWALEAFRFTLPRALGQARLQAVRGSLKYADTKQAV